MPTWWTKDNVEWTAHQLRQDKFIHDEHDWVNFVDYMNDCAMRYFEVENEVAYDDNVAYSGTITE